jgi:hypothetical protein
MTSTQNWGGGGVAFIDPEIDESAETLCRTWLITGGQYGDLRQQEGVAWYDDEVTLGEIDGIPILTVTHRRRLIDILPPSPAYLKTIAVGLRETAGWSDDEIAIYLLGKTGIQGRMRRHEIMALLEALD